VIVVQCQVSNFFSCKSDDNTKTTTTAPGSERNLYLDQHFFIC